MSATCRACSLAMSSISLSFSACSRASSRPISASSSSSAFATSAMRRSRSARSSASLRWMLASCSSSVLPTSSISRSRRAFSSSSVFWISAASRRRLSSVALTSRSARMRSSACSLSISFCSTAMRWSSTYICLLPICCACSLATSRSWWARANASCFSISSSSSWVSSSRLRMETVVRFSVLWTWRLASEVTSVMTFRPSASNTLSLSKNSFPLCSRVTMVTSSRVRPLAWKLSTTLAWTALANASRFSCSSLRVLVAA